MNKITSVKLNQGPDDTVVDRRRYTELLTLTLDDGKLVHLAIDGDCCSSSYFEENSVKDAYGLVGQTLVNIEHVSSALNDKDEESVCTKYHAIKITTDKEVVVLDWRNESNGYYDGTCEVLGFPVPK